MRCCRGTNAAAPDDMIRSTVRILPAPHRYADVLEILRLVHSRLQDQAGCTDCHIYEEDDPRSAIVLVERWSSEEGLDAHLRSDLYRRILAAIELSDEAPEIRFEHISASEGVERIEQSRSRAGG
jgi:quinol monooxygenase YgiN